MDTRQFFRYASTIFLSLLFFCSVAQSPGLVTQTLIQRSFPYGWKERAIYQRYIYVFYFDVSFDSPSFCYFLSPHHSNANRPAFYYETKIGKRQEVLNLNQRFVHNHSMVIDLIIVFRYHLLYSVHKKTADDRFQLSGSCNLFF